ncbi:MAG: hypothetical protein AAF488_04190 [Planctomycetota bacterium]
MRVLSALTWRSGSSEGREASRSFSSRIVWIAVVLLTLGAQAPGLHAGGVGSPAGPSFIRGDIDQDGQVLINDPIALLAVIFGPDSIECEDAGDANNDNQLNIADPIYLLGFLFSGGPAPPEPFPFCGIDFDGGLSCFDSALSCQPTQYSYVLNGNNGPGTSVLAVETSPFGVTTVTPLFVGNPEFDDLVLIEVPYVGEIAALQENPTSGENRFVWMTDTGTILDEEPYTGTGRALVASDFGVAYWMVTTESPPTTTLYSTELFGTAGTNVVWEATEEYDVRGLTLDFDGNVYFSGSGSPGAGLFQVDSLGALSLVAPDSDPGPIQMTLSWFGIWMLSNPASEPPSLMLYEFGFGFSFDVPLALPAGTVVGDIGIDSWNSTLFVPLPATDEVLRVDEFSIESSVHLTAADGLVEPIDVAGPFSFAIP